MNNKEEIVTEFYATKRVWYTSAAKQNSIVWYPVYKMFSNDSYAIGASQAVRVDGEIIGVVAADLTLNDLSLMLKSLHKDRKGLVLLLDHEQKIIADNHLFENEIYQQLTRNNLQMINSFLAEKKSIVTTENLIIKSNKIQLGQSGMFWLLNAVSEKEVLDTIFSRARKLLWVALFTLIVTVIFVWVIASYLLQPLNKLEYVSLQLSKEQWDVELPKSRLREIHNLSSAYRIMAQHIHNAMRHLEEKIQQRTTKLVELNKQLEKSALTDEMTQLGNRKYYNNKMDDLWSQKQKLFLAIADVDYFKLYNDTYGHVKGDECLKQIAQIIEKSTKDNNTEIARMGGEEFAMIFFDMDKQEVIKSLEKLKDNLNQANITHEASKVSNNVTISIGVAQKKENQEHWQYLYKAADNSLYKAKNSNRNCIVCDG